MVVKNNYLLFKYFLKQKYESTIIDAVKYMTRNIACIVTPAITPLFIDVLLPWGLSMGLKVELKVLIDELIPEICDKQFTNNCSFK